MKNKIIIIFALVIIFLSILIIFVVIKSPLKQKSYHPPEPKSNEVINKIDKNNDGKVDNWVYKTKEGTPTRWIRDDNLDGRPDNWSFFKNGQAFLDEVDLDKDGKVDVIYLNIWDENKIKMRGFSFTLSDKKRNIFVEHEDTGWLVENTENENK